MLIDLIGEMIRTEVSTVWIFGVNSMPWMYQIRGSSSLFDVQLMLLYLEVQIAWSAWQLKFALSGHGGSWDLYRFPFGTRNVVCNDTARRVCTQISGVPTCIPGAQCSESCWFSLHVSHCSLHLDMLFCCESHVNLNMLTLRAAESQGP